MWLVGWFVSWHFFSKTALTMLLKICTQWDIDKRGKLTKPDYPKKNFGLIKKYENVVKMTLFRLFIENGSNDFSQNAPECRTNQYRTACENRMSSNINIWHCFEGCRKRSIFSAFLNDFWAFSRYPLEIFRWNLVRSETKWIQSSCKRLQANKFIHFGDFKG